MEIEPPSAGVLLRQTFGLLKVCRARSLLACVGLAALGTADEMLTPDSFGLTMVYSIISLALQYDITSSLLSQTGLMQAGNRPRRFAAMIGLGLLSGFAILLGLILLVVPGIVLLIRWFIAVPVLVGEEVGVTEAMQRSWDQTSGWFSPIFAAIVVIYAPTILAMGALILLYDEVARGSWSIAAASNLVMAGCTIVGWHAAVAIYGHGRNAPRLAEVFA